MKNQSFVIRWKCDLYAAIACVFCFCSLPCSAGNVGEGVYYIYNVGANAYLSDWWNGEASLRIKGGLPFRLRSNGENFDIVMEQDVFQAHATTMMMENINENKVYIDVVEGSYPDYAPWRFVEVEGKDKVYHIVNNSTNRYLEGWLLSPGYSFRTRTSRSTHSEFSEWKLVSAEERLAGASAYNPVDATFLISVPNLSRTDMVASAWTVTDGGNGTYNLSGGVNNFHCAEAYNNDQFDIYQTLSGLPAGRYAVTVSGFYRYGSLTVAQDAHAQGTENLNNAVFYANGKQTPFVSIFEDAGSNGSIGASSNYGQVPNSMNDASAYFYAGCYAANQVVVDLSEGEDLKIGVKKNGKVDNDWLTFGNFRLTYYGADKTDFVPKDYTSVKKAYLSWTGNSGSFDATPSNDFRIHMREEYSETNKTGDIMTQTISDIENGTYELVFLANASYTSGRGYISEGSNGDWGFASVFAGGQSQVLPLNDVGGTLVDYPSEWVVSGVKVTDHTLDVGLRKDKDGTNWHILRLKSVKLVGAPDLTSYINAYEAALQRVAGMAARQDLTTGVCEALQTVLAECGDVDRTDQVALQDAEARLTQASKEAEECMNMYATYTAYRNATDEIVQQTDVYTDEDGVNLAKLRESLTETDRVADAASTKEAVNQQSVQVLKSVGDFIASTNTPSKYFDLTPLLLNTGFETSKDYGWKISGSAVANYIERDTFHAIEFFNGTFNIAQTLPGMPAGTYKVSVDGFYRPDNEYSPGHHQQDNVDAYLYLNEGIPVQLQVMRDNVTDINSVHEAMDNGEYKNEAVADIVGDEVSLTFGVKCDKQTYNYSWTLLDNFRLYYTIADIETFLRPYNEALTAAKEIDTSQKMNNAVRMNLTEAIAYDEKVDKSDAFSLQEATESLKTTTAAALKSIDSYAAAAVAVSRIQYELDHTNFVTPDALSLLSGYVTAYQEGIMDDEFAATLEQRTFRDGVIRADNFIDDYLLSAWREGETPMEGYAGTLYVNTWSVEGEADSTGFSRPFYEFSDGWTTQTNAHTITGELTEMQSGMYEVKLLLRTQIFSEHTALPDGITLQLNAGDKVVVEGEPVADFRIAEYTLRGEVGEDGLLTLTIDIPTSEQSTWLSFRNVWYERVGEPVSIESVNTGKRVANTIFNMMGQPVDRSTCKQGVYIINNKKVFVR